MRSDFLGYYAPTEEEYKRLWHEGVVVLDTNVLLDLYRLPQAARNELFAVLETLKERLWIPYHVALEFQRRRLLVIASERKLTEEALTGVNHLFGQVQEKFSSLQIEKRGLDIQSEPILADLRAVSEKLVAAIKSAHQAQLDIAVSDPVRDRLDLLLEKRVGPAPSDQADLDLLVENGQVRFDNRIPPGFADLDKEKNPNEAAFYHDDIIYQRKFGDLVIWRQIIRFVKERSYKAILFITSDNKEDWWWREKGKTIGPRPELCREISKLGGAELFWMYSSVQFLENARRFTKVYVSESSVSELKEVSRQVYLPAESSEVGRMFASKYLSQIYKPNPMNYDAMERSVLEWLRSKYDNVKKTDGFPDIVAEDESGLHGYELKYVRDFSKMLVTPAIVNSMLRGYLECNEGRLSYLSLVIVIAGVEQKYIADPGWRSDVDSRMRRLLNKYPIHEIVVGYVDDAGAFVAITNATSEYVEQAG